MVLVDTSVWINYLRGKEMARPLAALLEAKEVATHPWIIGELMVGRLGPRRTQILEDIGLLARLPEFPLEEVREFVERESLVGKGLSYPDVHLLYTAISEAMPLWTHDRVLHRMAHVYRIGWAASP